MRRAGPGRSRGPERLPPDRRERRYSTISQLRERSRASFSTRSMPGPQSMTSRPPPTARIVSAPGPPYRRSRPKPPLSWSRPRPPRRTSSPRPPSSSSSPLPPARLSLPVRPNSESSPSPPYSLSEPPAPSRKSSPPPPLMTSARFVPRMRCGRSPGRQRRRAEVAARQLLVGGGAQDDLGVDRHAEAVPAPEHAQQRRRLAELGAGRALLAVGELRARAADAGSSRRRSPTARTRSLPGPQSTSDAPTRRRTACRRRRRRTSAWPRPSFAIHRMSLPSPPSMSPEPVSTRMSSPGPPSARSPLA